MSDLSHIDLNNIPEHIAIIMDGNGRWAKNHGEDRLFGHSKGVDSVRETLKTARELNVKFLTLYAFSTENWNRPQDEVDGLMDLLVKTIAGEVDELDASNVRIHTIGDMDGLPNSCSDEMAAACERTKNNTGVNLVLALNYSAKWEILKGVKKIASEFASGESLFEADGGGSLLADGSADGSPNADDGFTLEVKEDGIGLFQDAVAEEEGVLQQIAPPQRNDFVQRLLQVYGEGVVNAATIAAYLQFPKILKLLSYFFIDQNGQQNPLRYPLILVYANIITSFLPSPIEVESFRIYILRKM